MALCQVMLQDSFLDAHCAIKLVLDSTGADQVTLDGVYHSPLGAVIAVDGKVGRPWYGSPEILPQWIQHIDCDESQNVVEIGSTLPPDIAADSKVQ